jgi:hypothetical protein
MRSLRHVSPTRFINALVVLALTGCGQSGGGTVGSGQTTNAVVLVAPSVARTSPSACIVDAPVASTATPALEERGLEMPTNRASTPSLHSPRYESNGSTLSDVGTPYPLPSVLVEPARSPGAAPPPSPEPEPFFETSFGPPSGSNDFAESSFGSDAVR